MSESVQMLVRVEPDGQPFKVMGRCAWALLRLVEAGEGGVTSLQEPAPRWSSYIHKLRTKHGLVIETEREPHGGPFAGTHARYRLHSQISLIRGEVLK